MNKSAKQLLEAVPGPTPWYLRNAPPIETNAHGRLLWRDVTGGHGKLVLGDRNGNDYLVLDFYCYFTPLSKGRALLWHLDGPNMHFRILNLDAMEPIDATKTAERAQFRGGEVASIAIPSSFEAGDHAINFPSAFRALGELLVLVSSNENTHLCLWSVRPAENRVSVFPQDWFNHGDYDFGYQWVTRVARDPATQRVVGEGIRLRMFQLDDSLRNVEKWL